MSARTARPPASGERGPARSAREKRAAAREGFPVTVEVISWVNQFVGGAGTGTLELVAVARPGDTVKDVLLGLSEVHPRLKEALWDPASGELGPHIEIVVNDAVLGIAHSLESPLRPGDRIALMGQYIGG